MSEVSWRWRVYCRTSNAPPTPPPLSISPPSVFLPKSSRKLVYFRSLQCALSTASPPVVLSHIEKLHLPSLEADSTSIAPHRPWTYATEPKFQAASDKETLIANEDAVIAAAAAEAVALAKAALHAARDAARLVGSRDQSAQPEYKPAKPSSEADPFINFKRAPLWKAKQVSTLAKSFSAEIRLGDAHSAQCSGRESDGLELADKELEYYRQGQLSSNVAVRSRRQDERIARRAKAAEKAAASAALLKIGPASRKKRTTSLQSDLTDPLHYLRGTTNASKVLTASEERMCSEGIQDLLKLEKLHAEFEERCGGQPTFAQWAAAAGVDQKTLRKRLHLGILCKDKIVKSNIRLVISIAKKYVGAGMSIQDLVQEGCRGLVRAAEKFDASKGFRFSTYAHWWIKQAVRKSISNQSRTIRLPLHMVEATYKVKEARKQLYNENGRHPDNEEVAWATGISMRRLKTILQTPEAPRSLDQKIGINMDLKLSEIISDPNAETTEAQLMKQFMKQDLEKVLDTLNPREKEVVKMRFGFGDGRVKTLQEIGESLGVSRERIRQIESLAFRKLKNEKRLEPLQQYLYY